MNACILLLAGWLPLVPLSAIEDGASAVAKLKAEFEAAQTAFFEKLQAAETEADKEALLASEYPEPEAYFERFLALADAHVGTEAACEALIWVAQKSRPGAERGRSLGRLLSDHAESAQLENVCRTLRYDPTPAAERFLRTLAADAPHEAVRGHATYALAHHLQQVAEFCGRMDDQDDDSKALREWLGAETVEHVRASDVETLHEESAKLLHRVADEFAGVAAGNSTLGEEAEGDLFELENLAIGQVAPDIEGEDVDGVAFALSDLRGRVVVLDFWGDW